MHRDYDYLIVGGGMVADAAANGIREQDAEGSIGIVGEETSAPFPRPALSKKLWTDPDFDLATADPDTARVTGAQLHLGERVVGVDPAVRRVETAAGDTFGYGELLLATGGHPTTLPDLPVGDRVLYYRTLDDYRRLRAAAADQPHVAVVGGGYIGSEIACALVQHGCRVTLVHPDQTLMETKFPAALARTFEDLFTGAGVEIRSGLSVESGVTSGDGVVLSLSDGSELSVDLVVVGLGIEPSSDYVDGVLDRADDGGIVVDEHLRTTAEHVHAAGDVASYPDKILGRTRVEHVDNAGEQGAMAGRVMAGSSETYDHTPMFYSDVFDHGYEAVGTLDSSLTVVEQHGEDGATIVYYLDEDQVRGVLLWDCDGGLDDARALLARADRPADAEDLRGTISCS